MPPSHGGHAAVQSGRASDGTVLEKLAQRLDVDPCAGHLRVQVQGGLEGGQSFLAAAQIQQDQTTPGERTEMAGLQVEGAHDVGQRVLVGTDEVVDRRPLVPAFGIARRGLTSSSEVSQILQIACSTACAARGSGA